MSDMNPRIRIDEEQRTEIVAYLDGELDPESAARIQKLLAKDADARRVAEELTIAWEALDSLGEVRASDNFTQKTVTNIQALAETESARRPKAFDLKRGTMLGGWLLGIIAAGTTGFCLANWTMPNKSHNLVRDVELIQSLPKYERAGSVDLLEKLKSEELFVE